MLNWLTMSSVLRELSFLSQTAKMLTVINHPTAHIWTVPHFLKSMKITGGNSHQETKQQLNNEVF